jgi:hypothetical protein
MARAGTRFEAVATTSDRRLKAPPVIVDYGAIERRAYELYLARGCAHGHDLEDWLQAERELRGTTVVVRELWLT